MPVKIRLSRVGKKHAPFYRIVSVDSRRKRDSSFLEDLGTYDALNSVVVRFDEDGYKVQTFYESVTRLISNDSVIESYDIVLTYEIVDGNTVSTTPNVPSCPYNMTYTTEINKLDILLDYYDYFSLKNTNLLESGGMGCGATASSPIPEPTRYSYELDSDGFVVRREKKEYYFVWNTEFVYQFQ